MKKQNNITNIVGILLVISILSIISFVYIMPIHALETCENYDPVEDTVTLKCDSSFVRLATIINDPSKISYLGNGEWLLNTTISTAAVTTFSIDSNTEDISWIKITNNHGIIIKGRGEIDGIKITSWDPIKNKTVDQNKQASIPRAYISFELSTGGWIKNSDIGYLGYKNKNNTATCGVSLYKSHDMIVSNNKFHHIYYAFYSAESYNVTIDNNEYYNNLLYAIDPHTDSHDFKITNNHIHNNYKFGIIFSLRCYNFLVENNTIHDNNEGNTISYGIFFSRMASNSIARNNTIYNESVGIDMSQSQDNFVYDNNIYNTDRGIYIFSGVESVSTNNSIYDNRIKDSKINIAIKDSKGNIIVNNTNSIIEAALVYFYNLNIPSISDIINKIRSPDKIEKKIDNNSINNNSIGNNSIEDNTVMVDKPRKNSTVIITFDDGSLTVYNNAFPILKANNQRAVSYIVVNRPDNAKNYMNWSILKKLYDSGWDISSHTVNHVDIKTLDEQRLDYELNRSKNVLISKGFVRSAEFIAYPFGSYDNTSINAVKKEYLTGRTTSTQKPFGIINLLDSDALYTMKVLEIHNTTPVINIKNAINETIKNRGNLILVYHIITPDDTASIDTRTSRPNFKDISDYIASRKDDISVITMSEYYDSLKNKNIS